MQSDALHLLERFLPGVFAHVRLHDDLPHLFPTDLASSALSRLDRPPMVLLHVVGEVMPPSSVVTFIAFNLFVGVLSK